MIMRFCRTAIPLCVLALMLMSAAPAGSVETYRFIDAVAEVSKNGFVDVVARTSRPLPREAVPEDDEVGKAVLGTFVLARRYSDESSAAFRTGPRRRNCYWQTKEYDRLPPELRVSQIGKRVRLSFRFRDGSSRKAIIGTALLVRPGQNSPRRLGCRK
jgi:hypothetical protein